MTLPWLGQIAENKYCGIIKMCPLIGPLVVFVVGRELMNFIFVMDFSVSALHEKFEMTIYKGVFRIYAKYFIFGTPC